MSLRDSVEAAVNTVEEAKSQVEKPVVEKVETPVVEAKVETPETPEQKAGRTAGRPRDEHGRLLPGKPEKVEKVEAPKVEAKVEAPVISGPKVPRPSSWKKDHWESWDKIALENPQLAEYLNQREGEFAKGVSTYKQEFENVKPLADAMEQITPVLRQQGIDRGQWISQMGHAHYTLAFGTPQQKLQMLAAICQNNQVPIQALYDPQVQQQFLMQQTLQPQPVQQLDVKALVQEQFTEIFAKQDLQQFQEATDGAGNPLYPHYQTVRNTMAQLLESNVAPDLKSAYEKAIRLHDDIWQAEQQAKQAATQKAQQEAQAKQVAKAKATAASVRTATPSGEVGAKPKGVRSAVEAAVDAHTAGGRV